MDIAAGNRGSLTADIPKMGINVLIDTIRVNKNFAKLIIYSLNTIKSYLVIPSQSRVTENAVAILESKIFS